MKIPLPLWAKHSSKQSVITECPYWVTSFKIFQFEYFKILLSVVTSFKILCHSTVYSSRKYTYFPYRGVGVLWDQNIWPKYLKACRGVGVLEKNPFCGGGMDIFWNYTLCFRNYEKFILHTIWTSILMILSL